MKRKFVSDTHKERFTTMIIEDDMSPCDVERASLFYIISGNEDLYRKRRYIYDTYEHCIRTCLDNTEVDFSSGMKSLISQQITLDDSFLNLDKRTKKFVAKSWAKGFAEVIFPAINERGNQAIANIGDNPTVSITAKASSGGIRIEN